MDTGHWAGQALTGGPRLGGGLKLRKDEDLHFLFPSDPSDSSPELLEKPELIHLKSAY